MLLVKTASNEDNSPPTDTSRILPPNAAQEFIIAGDNPCSNRVVNTGRDRSVASVVTILVIGFNERGRTRASTRFWEEGAGITVIEVQHMEEHEDELNVALADGICNVIVRSFVLAKENPSFM